MSFEVMKIIPSYPVLEVVELTLHVPLGQTGNRGREGQLFSMTICPMTIYAFPIEGRASISTGCTLGATRNTQG
jgi:hypothetical protein